MCVVIVIVGLLGFMLAGPLGIIVALLALIAMGLAKK